MTDEMKLFMKKIMDVSELKDFPTVEKRLTEIGEGFIFQNNRPTHVLLTLERYEALCNAANGKLSAAPVVSDAAGKENSDERQNSDAPVRLSNHRPVSDTSPALDNDEQNEVKIGKMMRGIFTVLLQKKLLSEEELTSLTSVGYSKNSFNANFPVLKIVADGENPDSVKRDSRGYNRYYDAVITVGGRRYMISSQWFEPLNRTYAERWILGVLTEILIKRVQQLPVGTVFQVRELLADFWEYLGYTMRNRIGKAFYNRVKDEPYIETVGSSTDVPHGQRYRKIQ